MIKLLQTIEDELAQLTPRDIERVLDGLDAPEEGSELLGRLEPDGLAIRLMALSVRFHGRKTILSHQASYCSASSSEEQALGGEAARCHALGEVASSLAWIAAKDEILGSWPRHGHLSMCVGPAVVFKTCEHPAERLNAIASELLESLIKARREAMGGGEDEPPEKKLKPQ